MISLISQSVHLCTDIVLQIVHSRINVATCIVSIRYLDINSASPYNVNCMAHNAQISVNKNISSSRLFDSAISVCQLVVVSVHTSIQKHLSIGLMVGLQMAIRWRLNDCVTKVYTLCQIWRICEHCSTNIHHKHQHSTIIIIDAVLCFGFALTTTNAANESVILGIA